MYCATCIRLTSGYPGRSVVWEGTKPPLVLVAVYMPRLVAPSSLNAAGSGDRCAIGDRHSNILNANGPLARPHFLRVSMD